MSKIQSTPPEPKKPEQPKPQRRETNAPPFSLKQAQPRQTGTPSESNTFQAQRKQMRTMAQARVTAQIVLSERNAVAQQNSAREAQATLAELSGDKNTATRFDNGDDGLPGGFFGEFTETPDDKEKGSLASALEDIWGISQLDDDLDTAELARMLPTTGNDGIFEVILPTGDRMGVVVNGQASSSSLSYLLSPATEKFGSKLRKQKMELEERVGLLTHRNVNITVL